MTTTSARGVGRRAARRGAGAHRGRQRGARAAAPGRRRRAGSARARARARGARAPRARGGPRDRGESRAAEHGARPGGRQRARRAHDQRDPDGARGGRRFGGARAVDPDEALVLDKSFNPAGIEQRWYQRWEARAGFAIATIAGTPAYCIQLPPPNVTGTLHMGHAFQQTLMDALIRYHRMRGYNTNWVVGTDHAGIATQIVVERQLQDEGKTRHDLGREKFVERVWQWKQQSGSTITRRCGASAPRRTGPTQIRELSAPATSPWTPRCRAPSWRCSSGSTKKDSSTAASAW